MNLLKRRSSPTNNSSGVHFTQQSIETCSNPTSSSPTPSTNSNASTCPNDPSATNAHQTSHAVPQPSSDVVLQSGHHVGMSTPANSLPAHMTNMHPHHPDPQSAAAALLLNHYHQHQQLSKNHGPSPPSALPMSSSSFAVLGNEPHQQLAAAIATNSPGLSMGGEHSAFRSLVNTPSAAAFALGLARQYAVAASLSAADHDKQQTRLQHTSDTSKPVSVNGSDSEEEEINVHDDSNDADASFYSSASGSEANQRERTPIQLVKHDR